MKTVFQVALAVVVFGLSVLSAHARLWSSTAGTQIEATHIATVNGECWLREKSGRIIKVNPSQLSEADQQFLAIPAKTPGAWPGSGSHRLQVDSASPETVATINVLASTVIPTLAINGNDLQTALDQLADAIATAAPDQPRVVFYVAPECSGQTVSMSLRSLSALRALELICASSQPHSLEGAVNGQRVELTKYIHKPRGSGTGARSVSPRSGSESSPVRGSEPVQCTAEASTKNLFYQPGFENTTNRWVYRNGKASFQRIPASETTAFGNVPALGQRVLVKRPMNDTKDPNIGPPFLTQEITVRPGTTRLRICCDLAASDMGNLAGMRLNVNDPNVSYTEGAGNEFPWIYKRPGKEDAWQHVEWEADVSGLKNQKLVVGFMFPFTGTWYLDNVRVTIVSD